MTQGCQALGDPLTITAADGNLILEIEGRPAVEAYERTLSDPRHPGLRQMTPHLLAGIGELRLGRPLELRRQAVRGRRAAIAPRWPSPSRCAPARRSASRCATRSARATT